MNEFRRKLKEAKRRYKIAERNYIRLKIECEHPINEVRKNKYGNAICDICGEEHGNWCEKSPDHTCHYIWELEDFHIILCDGSEYDISIQDIHKYTEKLDDEDICIFCNKEGN